ncbi:MAG: hypothetical protein ACT4OS_06335 [Acidimicrobiales bacterium]
MRLRIRSRRVAVTTLQIGALPARVLPARVLPARASLVGAALVAVMALGACGGERSSPTTATTVADGDPEFPAPGLGPNASVVPGQNNGGSPDGDSTDIPPESGSATTASGPGGGSGPGGTGAATTVGRPPAPPATTGPEVRIRVRVGTAEAGTASFTLAQGVDGFTSVATQASTAYSTTEGEPETFANAVRPGALLVVTGNPIGPGRLLATAVVLVA